MEAKRTALESIVKKQTNGAADQTEESRTENGAEAVGYPHRAQGHRNGREVQAKPELDCAQSTAITHHFEGEYPQKSPQLANREVHRGLRRAGKSKKIVGSSGRTRTYNPSVNSRMLCH